MSLDVVNPATGQLVERLESDTPATIARKAEAARAAQKEWAETPLAERIASISVFRELLLKRQDELAGILTTEVGKPITQSRRELQAMLSRLDHFIYESPTALADDEVHSDEFLQEIVRREPLGLVANVSAWNYPYFVGSNVFVPALIAGNAVLYKPSELATLTGLQIAKMLHESGVPREGFAPVIGAGEVGAALMDAPIDAVFFTGSYATGQKIAAAAGRRMIRYQLELGGKDPAYVADDVDVEIAASSLADGAFYNNGQSCCSVERIYVHEGIFDGFLREFLKTVDGFVVGDPRDPKTYIGPLARAPQVPLLEAQVADARKKGARIERGGSRIARTGNWFEPTVLTNVDGSMLVMREESFGPIIGIERVEDDLEASARMADTPYGLTAGVYSADRDRAERILRRLPVGTAYWNCCDRVSPRLPWSGRGHSGLGATLGIDGILAMTQPKAWHMQKP